LQLCCGFLDHISDRHGAFPSQPALRRSRRARRSRWLRGDEQLRQYCRGSASHFTGYPMQPHDSAQWVDGIRLATVLRLTLPSTTLAALLFVVGCSSREESPDSDLAIGSLDAGTSEDGGDCTLFAFVAACIAKCWQGDGSVPSPGNPGWPCESDPLSCRPLGLHLSALNSAPRRAALGAQ
jgi:hypothetical protein